MLIPPERACGITILPIKQRELRPAIWKGAGLSVEWGSTEYYFKSTEKGKSGEKWKVSHTHRLNEGLSGQTYRIVAGIVEWEVVCGDWRRRGSFLVIIWSLNTTPAPHSPNPEGSCSCCVYHSPLWILLNQTGIKGRTVYSHCLAFTWDLAFWPYLCMSPNWTNYIPD